jgi:hypothetical protein
VKGLIQNLLDKNPGFFAEENVEENNGVFEFMERMVFEVIAQQSDNKLFIEIT